MEGVTEDEASKARTGWVDAAIGIVWVNANIPCSEMERGECGYYYRQTLLHFQMGLFLPKMANWVRHSSAAECLSSMYKALGSSPATWRVLGSMNGRIIEELK